MRPVFTISINSNDVTTTLSPYITRITFVDNDGLMNSESDDLEIEFEDPREYFRDNPPARGSIIQLKFGYSDAIRNAGNFTLDTYKYGHSRSGGIVSIKALAKDITAAAQENKSAGYEGCGLKAIASEIATRQKLTLDFQGDDITFNRKTQHQERDLEFIQKLTKKYGYSCKVNNKTLVIKHLSKWFSEGEAYVITRSMDTSIEIETTSMASGKVDSTYMDPDKKDVTTATLTTGVKASGTTEKSDQRVENKQQAVKATETRKTLNEMNQLKGSISGYVGIPGLYAGKRVSLSGYGIYDKEYYASKVTHNLSRSGYTCDIEITTNPQKEAAA